MSPATRACGKPTTVGLFCSWSYTLHFSPTVCEHVTPHVAYLALSESSCCKLRSKAFWGVLGGGV